MKGNVCYVIIDKDCLDVELRRYRVFKDHANALSYWEKLEKTQPRRFGLYESSVPNNEQMYEHGPYYEARTRIENSEKINLSTVQ